MYLSTIGYPYGFNWHILISCSMAASTAGCDGNSNSTAKTAFSISVTSRLSEAAVQVERAAARIP
jgi:hypothetical protein